MRAGRNTPGRTNADVRAVRGHAAFRSEAARRRRMAFNVDPPCENPIPAATTDEQVMRDTIAVMEKHNIIGIVSGEPELMKTWRPAAPERIIPGIDMRLPGTTV